jgi:hypothetical protein
MNMKIEIDPPKKPTGRPSSYTEAVANEICQRMITGQGLLRICADDHMPDRQTVYRWLDANEGFRDRYVRAREGLMDFYAEQILVISFDERGDIFVDQDGDKSKTVANHAKVQRDRLKVDSLKWTCSRLFPKRYGDKMELLGQDSGSSSTLQIKWLDSDNTAPTIAPEPAPPKQITYVKPSLPADLSEGDWQRLLQILEVCRRVAPSDALPDEVLGVVRSALLDHFRDDPPAKRIVLPKRGKSGKT